MNLIDSYLSSFGMECEITTSEKRAWSMLETANDKFSKPFDLLIIDYETPEENAFSFPMMREDLFDRTEEHGIEMAVGKPVIQ
ncbi:MAG: two-component system, sensor histidine kinase and response regulator [Synergistaceae bacterium]|nr:two-component system, sensor histidine kinase and response regulator [Synergistaceae bacterium]